MMGQLSLEQMEMRHLRAQVAAAEDTATQAARVAVDLQKQLTAANAVVADLSARLDAAQVMILERDGIIAEQLADLDAISKAFRQVARPPTTGT